MNSVHSNRCGEADHAWLAKAEPIIQGTYRTAWDSRTVLLVPSHKRRE